MPFKSPSTFFFLSLLAFISNGLMADDNTIHSSIPNSVLDRVLSTGISKNSTNASKGFNFGIVWGGDPVNLVTGNFYHNEQDLSIPGRGGLPFVFERTYNSQDPEDSPLGYGWTHSFNHYLKFYGHDSEDNRIKVSWVDGSGGEKFFSLPGSTVPNNSRL